LQDFTFWQSPAFQHSKICFHITKQR
jgi:hypothetical protein